MTHPALLLLPGLLCDQALWQHQIDHLHDKCDIIVPDLTGADSMAALAEHVLANAPPHFILGGLSMGGYVALEIMRLAPQRVQALMLIDTTARQDSDEISARRRALIDLSKRGKFKGVTPRLLPFLVNEKHAADPHISGTIMAMAERVGPEAFRRQQTAILNRIDSRPFLPSISCKTLVLVGAEDSITDPDHAREMARLIPNADLHIIEDCGHLAPIEQPEITSHRMQEFLAGLPI